VHTCSGIRHRVPARPRHTHTHTRKPVFALAGADGAALAARQKFYKSQCPISFTVSSRSLDDSSEFVPCGAALATAGRNCAGPDPGPLTLDGAMPLSRNKCSRPVDNARTVSVFLSARLHARSARRALRSRGYKERGERMWSSRGGLGGAS
jgi:hypothetical protein